LERDSIAGMEDNNDEVKQALEALTARVTTLESALEEKDRELRELSIQRAEFVHQLNHLHDVIKTIQFKSKQDEFVVTKPGQQHSQQTINGEETPLDVVSIIDAEDANIDTDLSAMISEKGIGKKDEEGILKFYMSDTEKLDLPKGSSYRDRMILMNRIDIYRLFTTVMIISSEIKYPRKLTKIEERELKMYIEELSEFENMILDLSIDENKIWERGKVCEKQILQLFTSFFNV